MIRLDRVGKTYENKFTALEEVDLTLPSRGMIAIVGESGAGKSTLLNILAGNDFATTGNVVLDGVDYADMPAAEKNQHPGVCLPRL